MTLSQLLLKNATPKEKVYKFAVFVGLYLLVTSSGRKYWRMNYRFQDT
jgi:hypothetical protein